MKSRPVTRLVALLGFSGCFNPDDSATGATPSEDGTTTTPSPGDGTGDEPSMTDPSADASDDARPGPTTSATDLPEEGPDETDSTTGSPLPASVVAAADEYLVPQDQTLVVITTEGVLQNDSQIDGAVLEASVSSPTTANGGEVTMTVDGAFRYVAPGGFWGEDGFEYTATDPEGNTSTGRARVMVAPTSIDLNRVTSGGGGFCIQGEAPTATNANQLALGGDVDVNDDGFADIIIGDPDFASNEGQAYVVFGSDAPDAVELEALGEERGLRVLPDTGGDLLGVFASGSGDINGDGFDDFALGAGSNYVGYYGSRDARAYVLFGGPQGGTLPLTEIASDTDGRGFRASGSAGPAIRASGRGGDVNGDGLADVIIGTPAGNAPAYVVFGARSGAAVDLNPMTNGTSQRGFAIVPGNQSIIFGASVSIAGDVNGDGLADIVVGASGAQGTNGTSGRAFVVFGKAGPEPAQLLALGSTTAGFAIDGEADGDSVGASVAGAGDVNGDGLADIVIGAPGFDVYGQTQGGRGYVVFGRSEQTTVQLTSVAQGVGGFAVNGPASGQLGFVSSVGDLDGDGLADLAFGMPAFESGRGRVVVIYGRATGGSFTTAPRPDEGFTILGPVEGGQTGAALAAAGDVNADGFGDLVVGSPRAGSNGTGSDQICVLFGGDFTLRAP